MKNYNVSHPFRTVFVALSMLTLLSCGGGNYDYRNEPSFPNASQCVNGIVDIGTSTVIADTAIIGGTTHCYAFTIPFVIGAPPAVTITLGQTSGYSIIALHQNTEFTQSSMMQFVDASESITFDPVFTSLLTDAVYFLEVYAPVDSVYNVTRTP